MIRRGVVRIAVLTAIAMVQANCVSINLFSADEEIVARRSQAERLIGDLSRDVDAYARPPWARADEPEERSGLTAFLATISAAFQETTADGDPAKGSIDHYVAGLSKDDGAAALSETMTADLEKFRVIVAGVDAARVDMSVKWPIGALSEGLGIFEKAIGLGVRRRDGFLTICRRLDLSQDAVCTQANAAYGRMIAQLRADADLTAELLQRKSASISS